jgi:hypothetical protein
MEMNKGKTGHVPKAARKLRMQDSLVHPWDELPYAIYTNTSKLGISLVLTQESDSGETLVVSIALRVLTPTDRRYSTCEQELLVVVHALRKFRIYVVGHVIRVYSDNKALSFLKRCNLTSGRVTRCKNMT